MEEIVLNVKGMMCEGCENRVKKAIGMLDGVKNVTADHNTGKVSIVFDGQINRDSIIETIEDIGYEIV